MRGKIPGHQIALSSLVEKEINRFSRRTFEQKHTIIASRKVPQGHILVFLLVCLEEKWVFNWALRIFIMECLLLRQRHSDANLLENINIVFQLLILVCVSAYKKHPVLNAYSLTHKPNQKEDDASYIGLVCVFFLVLP